MWRAWGIFLLALSPQDLGSRVSAPDHEFAFQPPSGWIRHVGAGPTLVRYTQPGELNVPAEFLITHLFTSNPTMMDSFKIQAKENLKEKYPGAKILEEKDLTLAGKRAFRVTFQFNDKLISKTVVHRSNIEFFLFDAIYPSETGEKLRPLVESSLASFEIVPMPLSTEEKASDLRTTALIRNAKIDPALLGERWYSVLLSNGKKVGRMRFKMAESAGMYSFDTEVRNDFGDGNTDTTVVKGSFSPDGRVQKVDTEETKVNPKQKWIFRASAVNQGGQVKVSREINGVKEERSFSVEDGVLLTDIAECLRTVLVGAGRGSYLLKTLSPYSEEWSIEVIDVGGAETLEIDGRSRECILVQAYVGRRKNMTYYYAPDRSILRVGGPKDLFSIRLTTKEEAEK
jgi:hypothetical protein